MLTYFQSKCEKGEINKIYIFNERRSAGSDLNPAGKVSLSTKIFISWFSRVQQVAFSFFEKLARSISVFYF